MDLVEALAAERGLVCVVGAGGKKSTLWQLADRSDRAVVTATVRIPLFDSRVARVAATGDPVATLEDAEEDDWPLGLVPAGEEGRDDRYLGYDTETVAAIADAGLADAVLVKADGARMRELKAPSDREPQLPARTDTVLAIASAHVVGKPLTEEFVHRPRRISAVTGLSVGDRIEADDVAAVLASDRGGLKGVPPDATVVPVVNKVDDESLAGVGRAVAAGVLDRADVPRVALTCMQADDPLVAVVTPD